MAAVAVTGGREVPIPRRCSTFIRRRSSGAAIGLGRTDCCSWSIRVEALGGSLRWWHREVGGELSDGVGEIGRFDDLHGGGECDAGDGHGKPAEVLAADLHQTRRRLHLHGCVVHPSEHVVDFGERGVDGQRCFVVTEHRAE